MFGSVNLFLDASPVDEDEIDFDAGLMRKAPRDWLLYSDLHASCASRIAAWEACESFPAMWPNGVHRLA